MRILFDPDPRAAEDIFSKADYDRFLSSYDVVSWNGEDRPNFYNRYLPTAEVVISQQPMEHEQLEIAPKLRAIVNVETNFLPNVDYDACFQRGIHVVAPSSVFAAPVAEMGLGMALSLARGIHTAHGDFVVGRELYGLDGNTEAELLAGADVGFVGFGDLGRALHKLLAGFQPKIRAYDPWLPDGVLSRLGVEPASLDDVLSKSRFVFVVATITTDNAHLLNAAKLSLMQKGAKLLLLSRAAVADFEALKDFAGSGRIQVATDVFPEEPVAANDPIRNVPNILFSAHRAGALTSALQNIGKLVLEDLGQFARHLPPVACKRAERETVSRLRSKPIDKS
ncbi:dehydrogenase [Rhizobium sp. KVB221]|uniref:Dehydrogenase n=1 Tax=Rhizobium setariae TaxID=2801340 RepID=A0A936YLB3_9HYPH|nr:NAD(P)-dependent oxidoreductase [Rhizobium setariae]MBL0372418.1 dehydrogenase [Rhizobium setariae]